MVISVVYLRVFNTGISDANENSEDEWEDIGSDSLDDEADEDVTEDVDMVSTERIIVLNGGE